MKTILKLSMYTLFIILLMSILGCDNSALQPEDNAPVDPDPEQGIADFRFIHAASGTGSLDILYYSVNDGQYYSLQKDVSYGNQYGYYSFYTRDLDILTVTANTDLVVSQGTVPLQDNQKYTLVAHDFEATINPKLMILNDTLTTPASGYAFVRFIHLGNDVGTIFIKEKDQSTSLLQLDQNNHSPYHQMEARTYKFTVSLSDTGQVVQDLSPVTFLQKNRYTYIISGSLYELTDVELNGKSYVENSVE